MTTTENICSEYYRLFRGQDISITTDIREYGLAITLLKSAIQKWDRADGQLWLELVTTLQAQKIITPAIVDTVSGELTVAPTNIRKPPATVVFTHTDDRVSTYSTVQPHEADSTSIWFTGSANAGYVMHIGSDIITDLTGCTFEYTYVKTPFIPATSAEGATYIDMSDTSFAVHYMLGLRFQQARNGFGYQASMKEATESLANMKLENNTATIDGSTMSLADYGWGAPLTANTDIRL